MKLRYKIFLIIFIYILLFLLSDYKSEAYVYDISETINKKNCKYVVYLAEDNNFYLALNYQTSILSPAYDFIYLSDLNIIFPASNHVSTSLGNNDIYLLKEGLITHIGTFTRDDVYSGDFSCYKVKEIYYSNKHIYFPGGDEIYYTSNPVSDVTNVYLDDVFKPSLEYIEFVETLDGYFLRTNPLDYNLYGSNFTSNYYLMLYNGQSGQWENSNALCNWISYEVDGVITNGLQLSYKVNTEGVYIFRLQHKDNLDLVSNSITFNLTDFSVAKKYWYDVSAPIYSYGFENNKAVVYTNYLSADYYDNCLLVYVDNNGDSHVFVSSIISKEYNTDKTMFRFRLEFEEPVSYSCRFVLNVEAGFYYTATSSFNITESFFIENGYQEEQSFLGMIGDFLKNLFVGIFVPSNGYFETKINELGDKINTKIPYQQYIEDFEQLSEIEAESKDITVSADLSNYKVSDELTIDMPDFIDFSFLSKYQYIWFSWIRVVTYIGLAIFNINMLMKFLRGFSLAGVSNISNNNVKGG